MVTGRRRLMGAWKMLRTHSPVKCCLRATDGLHVGSAPAAREQSAHAGEEPGDHWRLVKLLL